MAEHQDPTSNLGHSKVTIQELEQMTDAKSLEPENGKIVIKEITKKLIRPYAAITFFHPAVLIALDELSLFLTDWAESKSVQFARGLQGTFLVLARSIKVHTDHQREGLYPEIQHFLQNANRVRGKSLDFKMMEIQLALSQIRMFVAEHGSNIQRIRNIGECVTIFTEKVKVNRHALEGNEEIAEMFQTITESIKSWVPKYKQQLLEEEEFLKPWISHIAANKVDEIKLVKEIIDSNREGIIRYQFGFVVSKLVASGEWTCSIKEDNYTRNETLAAYIRCFQMASTEAEYQAILDQIPKHIPKGIWEDLKLYGLDQPGSFRISKVTEDAHINNMCGHAVTCSDDMDDKCRIL